MAERFFDDRRSVYSFQGDTLVRCPRCDNCARSATIDTGSAARRGNVGFEDWFAPRRLSCSSCGYSKRWAGKEISRGWRDARDDFFGLPLWLQTDFRGETLWAYGTEHLDLIERFVRAKLRERAEDPTHGWTNGSLASRLPHWLKAAANREAILRAISELRGRLPR